MTNHSDNTTLLKSILFVEREPEWQKILKSLPLESLEISIVATFNDAIDKLFASSKQFHLVVTNIDFSETKNDNMGFELARRINNSFLFTQIIFLDRRSSSFRNDYAKIIFGELGAYQYIEKDMFESSQFTKEISNCLEEREKKLRDQNVQSTQSVIVLTSRNNGAREFFDEVIRPIVEIFTKNVEKAGENLTFRADEKMDRIRYHLSSATIVISDIRYLEPNIYYETGIADGYSKNTIMIAGEKQIHEKMVSLQRIDVPNIRGWRKYVRYELENRIRSVFNMHSHNYHHKIDVMDSADPVLCLALIPDDQDIQDTYEQLICPVISDLKLNIIQINNNGYTLPLSRIKQCIQKAHLIVVDLSKIDAFLCYCAGYANGLNKKLLFVSQTSDFPNDFVEQGPVIYSKKIQSDRNKAKEMIRIAIDDKMRINSTEQNGGNMKKIKVFINHASEDEVLAKWLCAELKKTPWIDPWLDVERILGGQDWKFEIDKALNSADAVLICMSNVSIQKTGYVQAEIYKAEELQKKRPRGKIFIIPILLEACEVPLDMRDRQWVDVSKPRKVDEIIMALGTLR